jgi:hypothetical protein
MIHAVWHWLLHVTGIDNSSGRWYGFWSGFASDLALFGGLFHYTRKHTCHVHRCWRIGRLHVEGTPYTVCRKHHPTGAPTHEDLLN